MCMITSLGVRTRSTEATHLMNAAAYMKARRLRPFPCLTNLAHASSSWVAGREVNVCSQVCQWGNRPLWTTNHLPTICRAYLAKAVPATVSNAYALTVPLSWPFLRSPSNFNSSCVNPDHLAWRNNEVHSVLQLLQEKRLVLLWGGFGTGKSSVALAAARYASVRRRYVDGCFFVNLRGRLVQDVPGAVLAAMRIESPSSQVSQRVCLRACGCRRRGNVLGFVLVSLTFPGTLALRVHPRGNRIGASADSS